MSKSDYLEKKVLDHILGGPDYVRPATVHIALFTSGDVTDAGVGTGTEVTGGAYERLAVTNDATNFPAATGDSPSTKTNANQLEWPVATADWGTIVEWGIFDAATAGNLLYHGAFPVEAQREIRNGDQAFIAAGALTITED